ncbi:MAG: response regulator [Candidatus Rokubacteria bacterium]|nr:response regulator [Candidatus Rokubacteria bacterium]
MLDAVHDPVLVTDASGVVTFANTAARDRLGAEKYVGASVADHVARGDVRAPDGATLTWDAHPIRRVLATGEAVSAVELVTSAPGRVPATWRVDAVPFRDGATIMGAAAIFREIVRVTPPLDASGDQAQQFEAIVNLVSDAVFAVDHAGRLLFANAVAGGLLGLPAGTTLLERHRRLEVHDADDRPVPPDQIPSSRALRGETLTGALLLVRDPEGQRRHIVTSAHPLRRPDGSIYGALVTMKDVTDEVRSRQELETARESAEEANHLKDQFIAALSHELRTPLQPILGWTEVLRRHGNLDAITAQALEAIRRNIRQQVRLVDDLLDLSRIVHGKLALRYETFDLREQIRAAAEPLEEAAALKRVRLTLSLPPEMLLMWGDGARVQQIATNLISNAVKFTPPGGHVAVQLLARGDEALLEVEDTGEGIAQEDLAVIFEAFRQGNASRRRGGLGIGLDLVRRLVELHGGSVDAFSEGTGYGARFTVRLPLGRPGAEAGIPAAKPGRRLDQKSILLIEDNADTREVMKFMLESEGATVDTAETGQEGLRRARETPPEVVLCDIGLPDIDGLEVARRIRRHAGLDRARLIALTGYGQPEDVRHALDAGFEAHLTKPINLDELLSILSA